MLLIGQRNWGYEESKWLSATLDLPGSQLSCDQLDLAYYSKPEGSPHNCPPPRPPLASRTGKIHRTQWGTGPGHLQRICRAEALVSAACVLWVAWRRSVLGSSKESCGSPLCWPAVPPLAGAHSTRHRHHHSRNHQNPPVPEFFFGACSVVSENQPGENWVKQAKKATTRLKERKRMMRYPYTFSQELITMDIEAKV